jgi:hypothetical protein
MIWRLGVVFFVAVPLSLSKTHVAVALNDTSANASNCGLAAGHDATGNVVNCGYPTEKMELMNSKLDAILDAINHRPATPNSNVLGKEAASPNISLAEIEKEFPLGFAIFYSDGRSLKYATKQNSSSGVSFDPSNLEVTKEGDSYCMNELPVLINGKPIPVVFDHVCISGVAHLAKVNDAIIDLKPLETSGDTAAWVIGAYKT